ncbi:uncharacterized protein LOC106181889 [Lingula anatina]|uniref:Uncharacterized protein LOC106181889 n=1 Tax=Lingula anatina TaxID=7574 RepID=A0A1S3KHC3_LINAN|nr:uncharacterized protein LOC106181889 [Lingula anatina]|eukprot:XP_013421874.1 uncharacterized protein LOC106181889 [Lingula anatina]
MVFVLSYLQAPLQALLRPALWLGCLFGSLHSHKERWDTPGTPEENVRQLAAVVKEAEEHDPHRNTLDIHVADSTSGFVRIFAFTKAEWLDVVEVKFRDNYGEAYSFSSGVLPVWFPFSFLVNCVLFWVPFLDMKLNQKRLELLYTHMKKHSQLNSDNI